jgi:hypothetical protein
LIVRNSPQALPRSNAPGALAEQVFRAPPGASIVALRWAGYRLRRPDARGLAYEVGLRDEAGRWYDVPCTGLRVCASPRPRASVAYQGVARHSVRIPHRRRLAFVVVCRGSRAGRCDSQSTGDSNSGYLAAGIAVTYAAVRVADSTPPEVERLAGPLWTGHVAEAPRAVEFTVTDNVGVRDVRLLVDGRPAAQSVSQCDPTRPVPCPARRRVRLVLEARAVPAGMHRLALRVTDAAGNSVTARRTTVFAADRDRQRNGNGVGWIAALALLGGLAAVTLLGLLARRRRRRRARRPVPTMEQVRARIAEMTAAGMTSQEIADRFNAERIPALFGRGTWRPASVEFVTRLFPESPGAGPRRRHRSFEEAGTFVPLSPLGLDDPEPESEPESEPEPMPQPEPEPEPESEPEPKPQPEPEPEPEPKPEPEPETEPAGFAPHPGGLSAATLYEIVWYREAERVAFALQPMDGRAAPWARYRSASFAWAEDRDPPASLRAAQRAHGRLKSRLDREGWRPAGRGESWFNHRVEPPDKSPMRDGGRRGGMSANSAGAD